MFLIVTGKDLKGLLESLTLMDSLIKPIHDLLREVGDYLLEAQHSVVPEWKGHKDPVTEADRESERRLKVGLADILPDVEFRGEESSWSQWKGLAGLIG